MGCSWSRLTPVRLGRSWPWTDPSRAVEGIAMRSDKTARAYRAAIALPATLIWIKADLVHPG